jgi:hypothetical protein
MKRRLLNLLTGLSLLLCVAAVVLWVRSYWTSDFVTHRRPAARGGGFDVTEWAIWTGKGRVSVARLRFDGARVLVLGDSGWEPNQRSGWGWTNHDPVPPEDEITTPIRTSRYGFGYGWEAPTGSRRHGYAAALFPLWLPAMILAAPLVKGVIRRFCRRPAGQCESCGYDLRATPGRCPECGGVGGRAAG